MDVAIRETVLGDAPALATLYAAAFPTEPLWPLVQTLLRKETGSLSLAAFVGPDLLGHVAFTPCGIEDAPDRLSLLGPLAVSPASQRKGVGSALVRAGLGRLAGAGVARVCVLGDPAYYRRLGFAPDTQIMPPYALPPEWAGAWQSQALRPDAPPCRGRLIVPPAWRRPALWTP